MMAFGIHDPAAVPEGGPPATPILMGPVAIEDKPAPFHFGVAVLLAASACHLTFIERQVHVLGGISVDIVNHQGTVAVGEVTGGKGV